MATLRSIDDNEPLVAQIERDLEPTNELGREFMRQFRSAIQTRNTTRIGDYTLQELLIECFNARDNKTSCDEKDFLEKYPQWVGMPISIVSFKVGILVALIRESLADVASAPFIIDPTPVPDIPEDKKAEFLQKFMAELEQESSIITQEQQAYLMAAAQQGINPNVAAMSPDYPRLSQDHVKEKMRQGKVQLTYDIKKYAEEQALILQKDLYDKTTEGGYRKAIMEFADDFATYPFGCIHGPFPVVKHETVWRDNKFVEEQKVSWVFERVSPFDLFWTDDCSSTQDGSAIFIRKRVGHDYLYDCRKLAEDDSNSGYLFDMIDELIGLSNEGRIPRNWTEFNAQNPENKSFNLIWNRGDTIEIVIRYGKFTGYDLNEMGFTDVDDKRIYETKTIMCGGRVIYCSINKNPSQYKRPVFTASFENRNGSIVGVGLGQKLLPLHKAYRSVIHLMMYNLGLSSEPITEVEVNRILSYMPDQWIEDPAVSPGMIFPADGDRMGNGSRAIKFTQIPNTTDSALRLANYIFEQAHVVSNIPAALHGQPVGSGANRTVRGLLTLQGNTLKPIHSALMNLDLGIIEPMITLLYMLLVMYEDDFEYSGDSKIVAKGAASMIQREMDKQTAMENLQILGQMGQAGQQLNPIAFTRAADRLLSLAGILEPGESSVIDTPPMGMIPQQATLVPQEQTPPVS